MTVKEHYENHLGKFYSWMTGDFSANCETFQKFLNGNSISPRSTKIAIDLGAGHGIQSIPLARTGFQVVAVDFNQQLLDELRINAGELNIHPVNADIKNLDFFVHQPELVVCCGDTLSHLESKNEIRELIATIYRALCQDGKIILSFRDYTHEVKGKDRFIPVKNDTHKILTCVLDYEEEFVNVTDLLYEKNNEVWEQKVSSYKKVRLIPEEIITYLEECGFKIDSPQIINRLITVIASK